MTKRKYQTVLLIRLLLLYFLTCRQELISCKSKLWRENWSMKFIRLMEHTEVLNLGWSLSLLTIISCEKWINNSVSSVRRFKTPRHDLICQNSMSWREYISPNFLQTFDSLMILHCNSVHCVGKSGYLVLFLPIYCGGVRTKCLYNRNVFSNEGIRTWLLFIWLNAHSPNTGLY